MKKRILRAISLLLMASFLFGPIEVEANNYDFVTERNYDYYSQPQLVRTTYYVDRGTTASGKQTRIGVAAGRKEWLGMTGLVYSVKEDGTINKLEFIVEFLDTGYGIENYGVGSLQNGTSIDIWTESLDQAYQYIGEFGDYMMLQIIPNSFG